MAETDIFSYLKKRRDFTYRLKVPTDSVATEIEADPHTVHIRKKYEVESVLKEAEFYRKINDESNGFTRLRHFRMTAVYPSAVFIKHWKMAKGDRKEFKKLMKRWLKENSKFCVVNPNTI